MRRAVLYALFFLSSAWADTLTLKNGRVVQGSWVGGDARQIRFAVGDSIQSFSINDVVQVSFGDNTGTAPAGEPARQPATSSQSSVPLNRDGFTVRLDRCEKVRSASVTCYMTITNTRADRNLGTTYGWDSMVDSSGAQQMSREVQIGSARGGTARTDTVSGVPVKASVSFPGVDPGVDKVAKLTLMMNYLDPSGDHRFTVEWRDIPLVEAQ